MPQILCNPAVDRDVIRAYICWTDTVVYTDQILDYLIDNANAIVSSYLCQDLCLNSYTDTLRPVYDCDGNILVCLKKCNIQSITSIQVQCICNNNTNITDACQYWLTPEGCLQINWFGSCGSCTTAFARTSQCRVVVEYEAGLTPLPLDLSNAYLALLDKIKQCVVSACQFPDNCTDGILTPDTPVVESYSIDGESVKFAKDAIDLACRNAGSRLIDSWIERVFKKYSCCPTIGIGKLF